MFFVIDRPRLLRFISITREDRRNVDQGRDGPYFRIEADGDHIKVSGLQVAATMPATVYEPGVLFLRVTKFRQLLATFKGEKFISIQCNAEELVFGNVHFPLESLDILHYLDPAQAPKRHPDDTVQAKQIREAKARVEEIGLELPRAEKEVDRSEVIPEYVQLRLFPDVE